MSIRWGGESMESPKKTTFQPEILIISTPYNLLKSYSSKKGKKKYLYLFKIAAKNRFSFCVISISAKIKKTKQNKTNKQTNKQTKTKQNKTKQNKTKNKQNKQNKTKNKKTKQNKQKKRTNKQTKKTFPKGTFHLNLAQNRRS